jgi:broad specificity phosphatase PhoE
MKNPIVAIVLFVTLGACISIAAQSRKTIILIRHAEKETAAMTDQADPPLSAEGKARAERVVKVIGRFHPGAIYSTDFKRTRSTVELLAAKREKKVEIYDPKKPQELIDTILKSKTKRFLIVGHSNTIPPLANSLLGKDLFKNLQETEYTIIWVVRMKDGKVVKAEILDY